MDDLFALPVRADQIECYATRESWLAARRSGIGGSDAAAVVGADGAYGSPLSVYASKIADESDDLSQLEHVRWGTRLERAIIHGYAADTGRHACSADAIPAWLGISGGEFCIVRHPVHDCMFCSPDGFQVDDDRGPGLLQVKTAHAGKLSEWTAEEPPLAYTVQCQHEMACTGASWCTLACLVGGNRLLWFDIDRNDEFIAALESECCRFWRRVEERRPPNPDGSEASRDALHRLYPRDMQPGIELPELAEVDRELLDLRDQRSAIDKQIERREQAIKAAMGEHESARIGESLWTWRTVKRRGYVVEPSESRVFRWSKAK